MSLQYIFNGYYRSGTTLVWEILRESNSDCSVFYEPLHPDLIKKIQKFKYDNSIDDLHGKELWNEYLAQGEKFIDNLRKKHIFSREHLFPSNTKELFKYLDLYDQLDTDVILQTNRLHFFLKDVIHQYNVKVIHIIRNPIDVYKSLKKIYIRTGKSIWKSILRFLYLLKNGHTPKSNMFLTRKNIEYCHEEFSLPKWWQQKEKRKAVLRDPFKTHLLSWVLCNYYALKDSEKYDIDIILYEDLIRKPNKMKRKIEKNTCLRFNSNQVRICEDDLRNLYKRNKIIKIINDLNINKKYNFILEKLCL